MRPQLGIAVDVVGDHRLLEPAQVERRERAQHAPGVFEGPAHVAVGHQVDVVADRLARGAHQIDVLVDARRRRPCGPQPKRSFTALKPCVGIGLAPRAQSVSSGWRRAGWHRPGSSAWCGRRAGLNTGCPSILPLASQSARSTALIAVMPMPLRPKGSVRAVHATARDTRCRADLAPISSGFR